MLTLPKSWTFSFVQRTVVRGGGAILVTSAGLAFAQAPGGAAAGGGAAAAAGGAVTPGAGGAAVGGNAGGNAAGAVAPGPAAGIAAPGVGVGGGAPGIGTGPVAPGVGAGGATPGVGTTRGAAGAGRTPAGGQVAPRASGLTPPPPNRPGSPNNRGRINNQTPVQNGQAQNGPLNAAPDSQGAVQGQAQTSGNAAGVPTNGAGGRANASMQGAAAVPGQNQAAVRQQQAAQRRGMAGTISGVQANSLTFNNGSASSQYSLTPDTRVEMNGKNVALDEIPPNANVRIFTNPRNPSEIQRIVAANGTDGAEARGSSTTETDRGTRPFEGRGNDIAGTANPDGSATLSDGTVVPADRTPAPMRPTGPGNPATGIEGRESGGNRGDSSEGLFAPTDGRIPPADYLNQGSSSANQPARGEPRSQASSANGAGQNSSGTNASQGNSTAPSERTANRPLSDTTTSQTTPPNRLRDFEGLGNDALVRNPDGTTSPAPQSTTSGMQPANRQTANGGSPSANGPRSPMTRETWNGPDVDLGWKLQSSANGVAVSNLSSSGIAAQAQLRDGDVITAVNGRAVSSPRDLSYELNRVSPESKVDFQVQRNGERVSQTLTLPASYQPQFPRTAREIADENRDLQAQIEAARNKRD